MDANDEILLGFIESILNEIRRDTSKYNYPRIEDNFLIAVLRFLEICYLERFPILDLKGHPTEPTSVEEHGTILLPLWEQTPAFQERMRPGNHIWIFKTTHTLPLGRRLDPENV